MKRRRLSRRAVLAVLAALLWAGFLVDGSHALFTDGVQLTGNVLNSGTANLLISNSQNPSSTIYEKTREGFTTSLSPGESYEKFFLLKNASDEGVDFQIGVTSVSTGTDVHGLAMNTNVSFVEVDNTGLPIGTPRESTVAGMRSTHFDMGVVVPAETIKRFKVTTGLSPNYSYQGESLLYDLVFTGTQVLSN